MMIAPDYLENYSAVTDFYGYWPSFHDAQVPGYREPTIEDPSLGLTLHTWRMTDRVDTKGYFILEDHSLVSFEFHGIHDADLGSFQSGNILFGLNFLRSEDSLSFRVELDSVMDMSGAFSATSGQIVLIIPANSDGTPA